MTAAQVAARFGCTIEQAREGFARTAAQMRNMESTARLSGKPKYRGYTVAELSARAAEYEAKACES